MFLFHYKYKTKSLTEGLRGAVFLTDATVYSLCSRSGRFAAIVFTVPSSVGPEPGFPHASASKVLGS